jgi:hypothetical protein
LIDGIRDGDGEGGRREFLRGMKMQMWKHVIIGLEGEVRIDSSKYFPYAATTAC